MDPAQPRKKILSTEALANLEKARAIAKKKREEQAELTRLKKQVEEKRQAELVLNLKHELGAQPVPVPKAPESVDEESEPEVIVKKKTKKKPIVIVEQSDSDSEDEQVVYIKRKSSRPKEREAVPQQPEPVQSLYAGMHPSMLLGRRRF